MSRHRDALRLAAGALDGPLGERDSRMLAAHLETCAACEVETELLTIDQDRIRSLAPRPLSAQTRVAVLADIRSTGASSSTRTWRVVPGVRQTNWLATGPSFLVLLAVLVALLVIVGIVASSRRLPPPVGPARAGMIASDLSGHIVVTDPMGQHPVQLTSGPVAVDSDPTWSPDGTRLAFIRQDQPTDVNAHLMVMNADGSAEHPIASIATVPVVTELYLPTTVPGAQLARGPLKVGPNRRVEWLDLAWSLDDRRIAFTASVDAKSSIFIADADGSGVVRISDPMIRGQHPTWAPDGRTIAFTSTAGGGRSGVYLIAPDGSGLRRVPESYRSIDPTLSFAQATWSPQGDRIAYAVVADGVPQVHISGIGGDSDVTVYAEPDAGMDSVPQWSPDGTRLAWIAATGQGGSGPIELANAEAAATVRSLPPLVQGEVVWAPDGSRVIAREEAPGWGAYRLVMIDVTTGVASAMQVSTGAAGGNDHGDGSWQRLAP
jgi:Tol biopolymer transport system component